MPKDPPNNFSEEVLEKQFKEWAYANTNMQEDSIDNIPTTTSFWLKVLADYKSHLRERLKKMEMPLYKNATNARDKAIFDSNYGYNQGLRNAANILS